MDLLALLIAPVTSSLAKTAGWSLKSFGEHKRRRRVANMVSSSTASLLETAGEELSLEASVPLAKYLASHEFRYIASLFAKSHFLYQLGKSADEVLDFAKLCLLEHLSALQVEDASAWSELLSTALTELIANEAEKLTTAGAVSPKLEAELRKTSISIVESGGPLLAVKLGVARRAELDTFVTEYKHQIRNAYGDMALPHAGTTKRVEYPALFVEPEIEWSTRNAGLEVEIEDDLPRATVGAALGNATRAVILGDPGGGKSTLSLKFLYDSACVADASAPDVPFLVTLRDYAPLLESQGPQSIVSYLESLCGFPLAITPPVGAVEHLLRQGRGLVVFDGLDELLDTSLRSRVVKAVESFAHRYPMATVLVTSRRVGYEDAPLDPDLFSVATLTSFTLDQVEKYASNWFSLDESVDLGLQESLTSSFVVDSKFVSDLRSNPLMLSLMCGIYARERYIPRNRPEVYDKCANLLLDSWDRTRGIEAALPFDALVRSAMRALALKMYLSEGARSEMSRSDLKEFLVDWLLAKRYNNEFEAEDAAERFLDHCKGRAWVLTDVGSDVYSFTHRTFLEYFAASQLVRENTNAMSLYALLKHEIRRGQGTAVNHLALQILGNTSEDGSDEFLTLALNDLGETVIELEEESDGELLGESSILSFCVQALAFLVPHARLTSRIVDSLIAAIWSPPDETHSSVDWHRSHYLLGALSLAAPENASVIQNRIDELLMPDASVSSLGVAELSLLWSFPLSPALHEDADALALDLWHTWKRKVRTSALPAMIAAWRKSRWVAVELYYSGEITMPELVINHGLGCLYLMEESNDQLVVPSAPPAMRLFIQTFVNEHAGVYPVEPGFTEIARMCAEGEIQFELSRSDADSIVRGGAWYLPISPPEGEALLFALPVIEALSKFQKDVSRSGTELRRPGNPIPEWAGELVDLRRGQIHAAQTPQTLASAKIQNHVGVLIRRWLEGEIEFTR